jgi:hypothetical protein
MKTLKVVAIAVVLSIAALTAIDGREVLRSQDGARPEFVGMFVPRAERVGSDDGAAFAIHFTGDTHGSLDTCG